MSPKSHKAVHKLTGLPAPEPRPGSLHWAAAELGVSERTVRNEIARGKLKARKIGARIVVYAEDIEAYRKALPIAVLK